MRRPSKKLSLRAWLLLGVTLPSVSFAVTLPGAGDSSRVQPQPEGALKAPGAQEALPLSVDEVIEVPKGAKELTFVLRGVKITGAKAIEEPQLNDLYSHFIDRTITLDMAWVLAAQITKRYKQAGYFLSRAYVPAQTIDGGILNINVVEGFVETVEVSEEANDLHLVNAWKERIQSYRPLRTEQIEQALLELNNTTGYQFRAVLGAPKEKTGEEGGAVLKLIAAREQPTGSVTVDNYGSRYLGPYRTNLAAEFSPLPEQRTKLSALASLPTEELQSIALEHTVYVAPQASVDAKGFYTNSEPGFTLKPQEVKSSTYALGLGFTYQWLRLREQSLSTRVGFDWLNTRSDILGTPLTRDKVRTVELATNYSVSDSWEGYNIITASLSQGVDGLGASDKGASNLSRAQAEPDFTKLEVNAARLQNLGGHFQALVTISAQAASGPIYSSEEFGYGGQAFGRAFDTSEIVGDNGINGGVEFQYTGIEPIYGVNSIPYMFYDGGVVWNYDDAQRPREHGSSAGFGIRANSDAGPAANLSLAFPIGRDVAVPIYGQTSEGPRLNFSFSYNF